MRAQPRRMALDAAAPTRPHLPAQAEDGAASTREGFVLDVAYSPDFSRIAASAMDGSVAIFDAATSQLLHRLKGHAKPVRSLVFTPGGPASSVGSSTR
jgi:WD40 repeat protein